MCPTYNLKPDSFEHSVYVEVTVGWANGFIVNPTLMPRIMRSLSRQCVNRVFAPEGEILSFAQPLESIRRKGGLIGAISCAPRFCRGSVERASCPPTDARHPCRAPSGLSRQNLRCSARQTRVKQRDCVTSVTKLILTHLSIFQHPMQPYTPILLK